ncbi:MAG: hypothetical protein IKO03_06100 [Lachnospiraceae bacterium]|nr:hypothetical protein [Lachnospiraceae bacterium]MBR3508317.1 hypothetical protein [Lachnospiraceae bacterium]MBR6152794.1 hypothetical protein [Lachnospiraceae bacterium]
MKALKRGIIVAFCIFMYLGVNVKATTTEDLYSSYNFQKGISLYYDSFDPNELNWEALTLREQVETLSLPVEMVETLSTEELAKWALNYPLLADLFLFDNAKEAMSYFSRTSYLFQTLFERTDNISVLLNAYDELQVDYEALLKSESSKPAFTESGYIKELFLQSYFSVAYESLTPDEILTLRQVLEEKHEEKVGICDDFVTATIFYDELLENYGFIPNDIVTSACNKYYLRNQKKSIEKQIGTKSDGFTSSGQLIYYNAAYYYVGSYSKYGVSVGCYKHFSGDYDATEIQNMKYVMTLYHPSWTWQSNPTKKYNCHSYAWIDASFSNDYWLNSPYSFTLSNAWSYIGENCAANVGDRIIISDAYGTIKHSLIVNQTGNDCNSINTISKMGDNGVYSAILADVILVYGTDYKVYR